MIKVVRESGGPAWTRNPPTAPGYYWLRVRDDGEAVVVRVVWSTWHTMAKALLILWPGSPEDTELLPYVARTPRCQWAGPIPTPQAVEGTVVDMSRHDVVEVLHNKPCCLDCNYVMRSPLFTELDGAYCCPRCKKWSNADTPRYNQLTSEQRSKMLELT